MKKKSIFMLTLLFIACMWVNPVLAYDFCSQNGVKMVFKIVGKLIQIAKIAAPLILIVMGMIDFAKAITGKSDEIKSAAQTFGRRIISCILIFFVITLVQYIFGLVGTNAVSDNGNYGTCFSCMSNPDGCSVTKYGENTNE